ncbi:MAG TPA: ABC transporter permease [Chitinophagaceae bacterium]|nr:ABC transporter permease [Chitinophagaceae bacterium]
MLKNHLKIAFRNLLRSKSFSAINISGLAIGMASAILIFLWIQNEMSFDLFHKNKDHLYEVWSRSVLNGELQSWNSTPKVLGPALKQEYPEIAEEARTYSRWYVSAVGEKKISSKALIADPSFLSMFSFPLVQGEVTTALNDVNSIVLTEKMAKKMFGDENPMNEIVKLNNDNFTVTGILKDLPTNTEFDFEYMLPWAYLKKSGQDDTRWDNSSIHTYVQLKPNASGNLMNAKIKDIIKRHSDGQEDREVFLHPISKWHLYSKFENGEIVGGRVETVRLFGLIAVLILLIACINFMNLSTARSEKRAKEVGIRKVAGANKGYLVGQFLGESVVIAFIAGVLAMVIVQLCLPQFDILVDKQLSIPYGNIYFWLLTLLFIIATGFIAGVYPAFFLSSFKPVVVLKGTFKKAHAFVNPRKVLVVLQFTFAIILIISTIVVTQQIRYGQNREIGYQSGQLAYHWITGSLEDKYSLLKNQLLNQGIATSVTKTGSPITENIGTTYDFKWEGKDPGDKTLFDTFSEDEGLVKTAGLKLVQGRDMDLTQFPTDSMGCLLNEAAVKAMNLKSPLGQIIRENGNNWHVVGIVKDFVTESPFKHINPMVIMGGKSSLNVINIKLNPANNTSQNISALEKLFKEYNPQYPFENHFVDEVYARKFQDTNRTAAFTSIFAGLTIFISCLGLFALAAYMAERRIKEIGVRKVLGASVLGITSLLSKEFLSLVGISFVVASPVAWYAMHTWLQGYSYRIQIEWWMFAAAAIISVVIALLTVSFQAIKAAIANPMRSLRTE